MSIQEELNRIALENGVQYFGVADLSNATDFIVDQGGKNLSEYPYAISVGIRMMDSIVNKLTHRNESSIIELQASCVRCYQLKT